ncbi:hupothetical protein [Streptococcus pyogenes]|nr:hupothetical protein [Streptococcus pyogenes]
MIDLKRNLFKIDVRAQKDEEKVFMRTAWFRRSYTCSDLKKYDL